MARPESGICDDLVYTKQYFTITRKGHTYPTADIGSPTLVWHVAFWPRANQHPDDTDVSMTVGQNLVLLSPEQIKKNYSCRIKAVRSDLSDFLIRLQRRGVVKPLETFEQEFKPKRPLDWTQKNDEPFDEFDTEVSGFTL